MKELGLEVETLEKSLHLSSPLGTRVRIDHICLDCELEILGILLTINLLVLFQGDKHDAFPQAVYNSRWHRQLMG